MFGTDIKRSIDTARDILVGKVPDPKTLAQLDALPLGMVEANHSCRIRSELYRIGQPIGPYDRMIPDTHG
jgi:hypothetical protein